MTARIGERVARIRADRKLTLQAVSDRCAELGVPLGRVTLTKLEGGKRQAITPAELTVLAAALDAAPVELLYPIGYDDKVEILPDRMVDPLDAVRWFAGELKLELAQDSTKLVLPSSGEESSVYLLQLHRDFVEQFVGAQEQAALAFERAAAPDADEHARSDVAFHRANVEETRKLAQKMLQRTRSDMRRRGMMLPDLPPSLGLDDSEEAASEH